MVFSNCYWKPQLSKKGVRNERTSHGLINFFKQRLRRRRRNVLMSPSKTNLEWNSCCHRRYFLSSKKFQKNLKLLESYVSSISSSSNATWLCWTYKFPFDHTSYLGLQTDLSGAWMGDHLGALHAAGEWPNNSAVDWHWWERKELWDKGTEGCIRLGQTGSSLEVWTRAEIRLELVPATWGFPSTTWARHSLSQEN